MLQTNTPKTYRANSMSMINASIAICAAKLRRPISSATTMAAILTFTNSQRLPRKKATSKKDIQQGVQTPPVALTIAGSDSSAGAGIQADLKTFSALGVYGLTTLTCVVAEIPGKVSCIEPVSSDLVREQIAILSKNFPIGAAKMGLLCTAEIVEAVARALLDLSADSAKRFPLVVDPVIIATSGDRLLEPA